MDHTASIRSTAVDWETFMMSGFYVEIECGSDTSRLNDIFQVVVAQFQFCFAGA